MVALSVSLLVLSKGRPSLTGVVSGMAVVAAAAAAAVVAVAVVAACHIVGHLGAWRSGLEEKVQHRLGDRMVAEARGFEGVGTGGIRTMQSAFEARLE